MKTCWRSSQNVVEEPGFRMQASAVKQLFLQIINVFGFEFEFSLHKTDNNCNCQVKNQRSFKSLD